MSRLRLESLPEKPHRPHDYFDIPDERVAVRIAGRDAPITLRCKVKGSGRPLLLVHGLMTSSYSFRYVITPLAERFRVIVPDLPGAGASDAPTDLPMDAPTLARVLAGLCDAMQLERPLVVGNSLGGYVSLWLAVQEPKRIDRLVVMHAPGFPELRLHALRFVMSLPGSGALFRWLVTRQPERFVMNNVHYHDPAIMSLEEAREYGAIFRDPARTEVFRRILAETLVPATMRELAAMLPTLELPILLLWAKQDVMVSPAFGPRYKALLPRAELVWLDETSHFMHVDTPEQTLAALLPFLTR